MSSLLVILTLMEYRRSHIFFQDPRLRLHHNILPKFRFGDYTFYNFFSIDASIEEIPNPKSVNKNLSLKVVNFIEGIK